MQSNSIPISSNSTRAISLTNGDKMNAAIKHIHVSYQLAHEYTKKSYITIIYVPSIPNAADRIPSP